jgi:hypothetical protein
MVKVWRVLVKYSWNGPNISVLPYDNFFDALAEAQYRAKDPRRFFVEIV